MTENNSVGGELEVKVYDNEYERFLYVDLPSSHLSDYDKCKNCSVANISKEIVSYKAKSWWVRHHPQYQFEQTPISSPRVILELKVRADDNKYKPPVIITAFLQRGKKQKLRDDGRFDIIPGFMSLGPDWYYKFYSDDTPEAKASQMVLEAIKSDPEISKIYPPTK